MNIAVDFDGVIHRYSKGWQDGSIYDPPMPGCREALERLRAQGHKIIIFSTRCHDRTINGRFEKSESREVGHWLEEHEIPYDLIWEGAGKPMAHVYLDDRAVRFTDWDTAILDIQEIAKEEV